MSGSAGCPPTARPPLPPHQCPQRLPGAVQVMAAVKSWQQRSAGPRRWGLKLETACQSDRASGSRSYPMTCSQSVRSTWRKRVGRYPYKASWLEVFQGWLGTSMQSHCDVQLP